MCVWMLARRVLWLEKCYINISPFTIYPPLCPAVVLPLARWSQLWTLSLPSPSLTPSTWTRSSTCWCLVRASSTMPSLLCLPSKSLYPLPRCVYSLGHTLAHINICPCVMFTQLFTKATLKRMCVADVVKGSDMEYHVQKHSQSHKHMHTSVFWQL